MKTPLASKSLPRRVRPGRMAEGKLLILPDGRIMAHTITPALAEVLKTVSLDESLMRYRAHLVDRQQGVGE